MSARIEYLKKEIRVVLDGEIDHHSASLIRISIDDAIIHKRPQTLILDFSKVSFMDSSGIGVTFMDSSGIGLVMGRYKLMRSVGGRIRVENLSPAAYKVMKLAGLEKLGELKLRATDPQSVQSAT